MWLSLYILVPFEYFKYLHRFAFICQDYLLLLTVFILLFLIELPNSISSWQRIQDITNRLSTLLDWQSLEVDLYHTLSSLRSKMTLDGSHRISHSILPEFTTRYTCMIQLSYDPPLLKRQLTYASHFIPSLVYSIDEKPTYYEISSFKLLTFKSLWYLPVSLNRVVFLVPSANVSLLAGIIPEQRDIVIYANIISHCEI